MDDSVKMASSCSTCECAVYHKELMQIFFVVRKCYSVVSIVTLMGDTTIYSFIIIGKRASNICLFGHVRQTCG